MIDNKKMKKLSIIIPAYNEEKTIAEVLKRVKAINLHQVDIEIIVVDNNSKDRTKEIAQKTPGLKVFTETKKGKGSAVKKGLEKATGDFLIIQDADLEYNPSDIPKLCKIILDEKTIVYGTRNMGKDRKGGLFARLGVWFLTKQFNFLFNSNITDLWTCYKLFPKEASRHFTSGGFESELSFSSRVVKNGYKIVDIPISYNNPRTKAEGKKIRYRHGIYGIFILIYERFR